MKSWVTVNFSAHLTILRDTQRAGKHYFWVCLWGCFWQRLAFDSVDWVKKIYLHWGGPTSAMWGPKWNKVAKKGWKLSFSSWAGVSSFPVLGHQSSWFLGFWTLELYSSGPLDSQAFDLGWVVIPTESWFSGPGTWTELYHQLPGLSASRQQITGLLGLYYYESQFL